MFQDFVISLTRTHHGLAKAKQSPGELSFLQHPVTKLSNLLTLKSDKYNYLLLIYLLAVY